eukprot:7947480-Ditylum_brightwellii.AAC.1
MDTLSHYAHIIILASPDESNILSIIQDKHTSDIYQIDPSGVYTLNPTDILELKVKNISTRDKGNPLPN